MILLQHNRPVTLSRRSEIRATATYSEPLDQLISLDLKQVIDKPSFARPGRRCEVLSSPHVMVATHRSPGSRTISWPHSRRFGMRSARRCASRPLDRRRFDLGLGPRLRLGPAIRPSPGPNGFCAAPGHLAAQALGPADASIRKDPSSSFCGLSISNAPLQASTSSS